MLALIRMEWTLNRRLLLQLTPLFALFAARMALGLSYSLTFYFMLATLLTVLPLCQDLKCGIQPFLCALPVSRGQIVRARYLTAMGALAVAMGVSLALGWAFKVGGAPMWQRVALEDLLLGLGVQGFLLAAGLFLFLPFHYRFGGDLGLGVFMGSLAASLLVILASFGWHGAQERGLALVGLLLEGGRPAGWALLAGLTLGLASLGLSVQAYRKALATVPSPVYLPTLLLALALGLAAVSA